jgi:hypothetical protein
MDFDQLLQWIQQCCPVKAFDCRELAWRVASETAWDPCLLNESTHTSVRRACNRLVREGFFVRLRFHLYQRR